MQGKKKCILCNSSERLTREHRLPASLLKKFNELEGEPDGVLLSISKDKTIPFSNISNANILKPIKNICVVCNSTRSTSCDLEFDKFVSALFNWGQQSEPANRLKLPSRDEIKNELTRFEKFTPTEQLQTFSKEEKIINAILSTAEYSRVEPNQAWKLDEIHRYLCKHSACLLERQNINCPSLVKKFFLNNVEYSPISFTPYVLNPQFQGGYNNTEFIIEKHLFQYSIVFSNVIIKVKVPLEETFL